VSPRGLVPGIALLFISQRIRLLMTTAVKTSNPTKKKYNLIYYLHNEYSQSRAYRLQINRLTD
jgi:hypothetical protein